MMLKIFILPVVAITLSLFAPLATAEGPSPCQAFAGNWIANADSNQIRQFNGLKINWNPINTGLSIEYNSESSNWSDHFIESYFADSEVHIGDGRNTGNSYVASCDVNMIQITREGLLIKPLLTRLTLSGNELLFWSGIEGTQSPIEEKFSRK